MLAGSRAGAASLTQGSSLEEERGELSPEGGPGVVGPARAAQGVRAGEIAGGCERMGSLGLI